MDGDPQASRLNKGMDSNEFEILALVEKAVAGPHQDTAQRQLFEMFEPKIEARARQILQERYSDIGDDAVIGSFTKAFTKLDTFKGEGRFEGWLLRICRNFCLDLVRKPGLASHQIIRSLFQPDEEPDLSLRRSDLNLSDPAACPHEATVRREQVKHIREALENLKTDEYTLAVMVMKGFSNSDIATELGRTVPAVERLRLRTLEKLETQLRKIERHGQA